MTELEQWIKVLLLCLCCLGKAVEAELFGAFISEDLLLNLEVVWLMNTLAL